MKRVYALISLLFVILAMTSCGPSSDKAMAYNDKIIDEQIAIIDRIDFMYESFKNFVPEEMDKAYNGARMQIDSGIIRVSKMEAFDESTHFRDSAIILFNVYKSVFENEFKEMVSIYKLPDKKFTKEQKDKWMMLSDQAKKKMNDALQKLQQTQNAFTKKYKFKIKKIR
jgi:hypothetical protein